MPPGRCRWFRLATTSLLTFALLALSGGPQASAARFKIVRTKLARGLIWLRITDSVGPNRINALVLTPSKRLKLDVTMAGSVLPVLAKTSAMAKKAGALAAVNGDFGAFDGRAAHPFFQRGDLVQTGDYVGYLFALTRKEHRADIGRPDLTMTVSDSSGHKPRKISDWNGGGLELNKMIAYTNEGGTIFAPPNGACSARLVPTSIASWTAGKAGKQQTYSVDTTECGGPSLAPGSGVVLSTLPTSIRAGWIGSLVPGQSLTIVRSVGWPSVVGAIGGMPALLINGAVSPSPPICDPVGWCTPDARAGVGMTSGCVTGTSTCKYILMTVDGLLPGYSAGLTYPQQASEFRRLGAAWALGLDGGGSETMWIKGHGIVNKLQDGAQRRVPNAVVVLAK